VQLSSNPAVREKILDMTKQLTRRTLAHLWAGIAAAGVLPGFGLASAQAVAWNADAFKTRNMNDAATALGGKLPTQSASISIYAPEISENGGVVPVHVKSELANTQQIALLVDKNPTPLAAVFEVSSQTEADLLVRIKMAQSSNVIALVKANDQYFYAVREIRVTLGGCGG
jgi:sulfur-oxidizing protein SoxY